MSHVPARACVANASSIISEIMKYLDVFLQKMRRWHTIDPYRTSYPQRREDKTMLRIMCKGKIHKAHITKKDLHYHGSIGIDKKLLHAADMLAGEKVQVLNINNGMRFETYCIEEKLNSGIIALYGPAARLGAIGDTVIIISYGLMDTTEAKKLRPKIAHVDKNNRIV